MADLPDYADTYDESPRMAARKDPLSALQRIRGLKNLTFLFYGMDFESLLPHRRVFEIYTKALLAHPVNMMAWNEIPGLHIKLFNLYPKFFSPLIRPSVQLRVVDAALSTHETIPGFVPTDLAIVNAMQIINQMRSQGWAFDDALLSHDTGVWPLKELPDGSIEKTHICEDREGWQSRQSLEESWCEYLGEECGVWYTGCVKCWRSDTKDECNCTDGGTFLSRGWEGPTVLIGNPGVPIEVDTGVSEDKKGDVMWARSAAIKDMDGCDANEWLEVFGLPPG